MKKHFIGGFLLGMGLLLSCTGAWAGFDSVQGVWTGDGVRYGLDGKELESFQVKVDQTAEGDDILKTVAEAILPDGQVITHRQKMTKKDGVYHLEGSSGQGTGYYLGDGVFQGEMADGAGKGMVLTTVSMGDWMRILVTLTENGRPVGYVRESLHRTK
jgi:hypothetical protein